MVKLNFLSNFTFALKDKNEINAHKVLNWRLECGADKFGSNHGTLKKRV